uniref:30S ribosomal protein S21 n=1 Tax=Bursaphelenchus xylophilus TaxID=6326 RepID=A0A1I7SD16_BURXY
MPDQTRMMRVAQTRTKAREFLMLALKFPKMGRKRREARERKTREFESRIRMKLLDTSRKMGKMKAENTTT